MSNIDINVDRLTDGLTDGQKIGRLYRTLLQAGAIKNSADPDQLKPNDLDLHCLHEHDISAFNRTRVNKTSGSTCTSMRSDQSCLVFSRYTRIQ